MGRRRGGFRLPRPDSYPVAIYESGRKGEKIGFYGSARGNMGRNEGKIVTGRFRINMTGAREGSFSCEVNNAIIEGKLACSHRSCIGNN